MKRRSFLKGILGTIAFALCPLPIPSPNIEEPTVKWGEKTLTRGRSYFDAGFVYCPYIPMQLVKAKV